mmetsp:Transcript_26395/g.91801  ORF Transcript_26395/g.91801 Transcript_26395/m.91801 type:complete len:240 (-) Transcript_26395:516-1235(-)
MAAWPAPQGGEPASDDVCPNAHCTPPAMTAGRSDRRMPPKSSKVCSGSSAHPCTNCVHSVQKNMTIGSRERKRAKAASSNTFSPDKNSCAKAKIATEYHSATMGVAAPPSYRPRRPDASEPPTMSMAPATATQLARRRSSSHDSARTSGILSRFSSDCERPGVCGCPMAVQKLPEPLKRPMATRMYHGASARARCGRGVAPSASPPSSTASSDAATAALPLTLPYRQRRHSRMAPDQTM